MEDRIGKLKSWRESVDFEIEQKRVDIIPQLYDLISDWEGQFPNLRDIFHPAEIDWLIAESVRMIDSEYLDGVPWEDILVDFVIRSGYKDEPIVDENGNISLRRTTPIHLAKYLRHGVTSVLFKIYGNHFINYTDESGYTYLHAASACGHEKLVEKFLELGQDPNCIWRETGWSPLHLALPHHHNTVAKLLLRAGACPNLADNNGFTPLHRICRRQLIFCSAEIFFELNDELQQRVRIDAKDKSGRTPLQWAVLVGDKKTAKLLLERGADPNSVDNDGSTLLQILCQRDKDDHSADIFFEAIDEMRLTVPLDARDKLGRTPLQLAVAKLLPKTVHLLLERGADLSSFIFPTENDFDESNKNDRDHLYFKKHLASSVLFIMKLLERRGYALDRSDALVVMKFFAKYRLFEQSEEFQKFWYEHEEFVSKSKEKKILPRIWPESRDFETEKRAITMSPSLLLHDLVRMPTEEAIKLPIYYYKEVRTTDVRDLSKKLERACIMHLCEMMSRRFFRRWTLDFFWELVQYRLPLLCCEIIIKKLKNEDLFSICLAAMDQSS